MLASRRRSRSPAPAPWLAGAVLLLVASGLYDLRTAAAQAESGSAGPSSAERARELFQRAERAVSRGNPEAAYALFRESLEVRRYLPTAYNLAVVSYDLERRVEAGELLIQILANRFGEPSERFVEAAEELLAEVAQYVGLIDLEVVGASEGWVVVDEGPRRTFVDGQPETLVLLPGTYAVGGGAPSGSVEPIVLDVAAGERRALQLRIQPDLSPAAVAASALEDDGTSEDAGTRRGLAWGLGITGALVVLGGTVALVFVLTSGDDEDDGLFGVFRAVETARE